MTEDKLALLRRSLLVTQVVAGSSLAALIVVIMLLLTKDDSDEIVTRRLAIVDENGTVAATLGSAGGRVALELGPRDRHYRVVLESDATGVQSQLGATEGPYNLVRTGVSDEGVFFALDAAERGRMSYDATGHGTPMLVLQASAADDAGTIQLAPFNTLYKGAWLGLSTTAPGRAIAIDLTADASPGLSLSRVVDGHGDVATFALSEYWKRLVIEDNGKSVLAP